MGTPHGNGPRMVRQREGPCMGRDPILEGSLRRGTLPVEGPRMGRNLCAQPCVVVDRIWGRDGPHTGGAHYGGGLGRTRAGGKGTSLMGTDQHGRGACASGTPTGREKIQGPASREVRPRR